VHVGLTIRTVGYRGRTVDVYAIRRAGCGTGVSCNGGGAVQ